MQGLLAGIWEKLFGNIPAKLQLNHVFACQQHLIIYLLLYSGSDGIENQLIKTNLTDFTNYNDTHY